jgi:RNA polymerase sigma-70 factor (ECF subfamily)
MGAELVAGLKRKDPTALKRLIAQHGAMLYRVALHLMGQREEAEEVLQETLLRVDGKIHTFDERASLTTWLYGIVVGIALTRLRTKAWGPEERLDTGGPYFTEEGEHLLEVAEWGLPPEGSSFRQRARTVLQQGIGCLPELHHAVYVLAEIEGLPHPEIATILGITVEIVKTCLHRARLLLREVLTEYWVERGCIPPRRAADA